MNDSEILERITEIASEELEDDNLVLTMQTIATDVPGWDSLAHVRIVVAVERAYRTRFETGQITSLKNVGDLVRLVQASGPA